MNSVTRMSDIGFCLGHGVIVAGDAGDDGYSCAVKAQVRQTNSAEKLMPFLGGVFREIDKLLPLLFSGTPNEGNEVSVKRGCMNAVAFGGKADGAALQIDVLQRHGGFGNSTTLSHCHEPRVIHPRLLFLECCFDFALLGQGDFWLLFWGNSLVPEFETRIGVDVVASHCFLQNGRENFQLCQCSIEFPRPNNMAGRAGTELRISPANLVRYLKRRDNVNVIKIGRDRRPRVRVSCQRFWIRVLSSKESGHPNVKPIALSVSINVQLAHGVLGGDLFDLPNGTLVVDSDFGTLICPGAIWTLISNPIVWACVSLVIRCHAVQHSAAKQNSSNDRFTREMTTNDQRKSGQIVSAVRFRPQPHL